MDHNKNGRDQRIPSIQQETEMDNNTHESEIESGGCLCGAVRYEINGRMRDVVNCHCSKCRRFHGHYGAYTSIRLQDLKFIEQRGLKWYHSITDETPNVFRGFCDICGSSLFWHPKDQEMIAVAAGSLDNSANLKTIGHIWLSQKGDCYTVSDNLPRFDKGWSEETGSKID
jgi:hypothetical protein